MCVCVCVFFFIFFVLPTPLFSSYWYSKFYERRIRYRSLGGNYLVDMLVLLKFDSFNAREVQRVLISEI